jgi:hypothetical protein
MFEQPFLDRAWLVTGCWIALFVSDYLLTIAGARLYASGARAHFGFEGSYELNPFFQDDIDHLRRPGFRFFIVLVACAGLLVIAYLSAPRPLYAAVAGVLLLVEVPVHFRHLRNLSVFRCAAKSRGMSGQIVYERWLTERLSAYEIAKFAVLFGITWMLTGSLLFLGGAVGCSVQAWSGYNRARRARTSNRLPNQQSRPGSAEA